MEEDNYQILKEWHSLLANGAITQQEFNALKSELLAKNILPKVNENNPVTEPEQNISQSENEPEVKQAEFCTKFPEGQKSETPENISGIFKAIEADENLKKKKRLILSLAVIVTMLIIGLPVYVYIHSTNSNTNNTQSENTQTVQGSSIETSIEDNDVFPVDSLLKTKLLTTGKFHSDEVWKTASKGKWTGIFKDTEGFYLKETTVKTKRVHDDIVDKTNENTGWEVTTSNKDTNFILIEALPFLADRKIQALALSKKIIYPDEEFKVSYLGKEYKIFATGSKKKYDQEIEAYEVRNYKLYLTTNINGRAITQLLAAQVEFNERMIEILFAGDIDGDGILDFIIDTSNDYNYSTPTLYLSRPADKGKIFKPLGYYVIGGC